MTQPPSDPHQPGLYAREQPGFPPGYAAPAPQPLPPSPGYGPPYYQPYPAGGYQQRLGKDPRLVDWLERFLARIIDGVVVFGLVSVLLLPIHISTIHQISMFFHNLENGVHSNAGQPAAGPFPPTGGLLVTILVSAVAGFAYDWLQHGLWGQTLGKPGTGHHSADRGYLVEDRWPGGLPARRRLRAPPGDSVRRRVVLPAGPELAAVG